MKNRAKSVLATAALICLIPAASLGLTTYTQDFEGLIQVLPSALADDGWLVFGNVSQPDGTYLYGYGPFVAPNDGFGFCQIDLGQGGVEQGLQQLSVFSDYNNGDHAVGNLIESNTFQEWTIDAADVGSIWTFAFQAKMGNLVPPSTALAFIKTLDQANGYALTNFISEDMTVIPTTWGGYSLSIPITADLEGQLLQIGFSNTATLYASAGVFYDNIVFEKTGDVSAVPDAATMAGATLRQNFPNPFNPMTRIEFALESAGLVDLTVYDIAGRKVANLHHGDLPAGEHHVTWNGKTDAGLPAPAGQYRYVLRNSGGQVVRSMVLLK